MTAPTLETERLILRAYRPADFDAYAEMNMDPEVIQFLGNPSTALEDIWTRFLRQSGMCAVCGFGFFCIEEKGTGRYLGEVGFQERKRDLTPSLDHTLESGWGIISTAQGRGIASEAMTVAMRWAEGAFPTMPFTALIDVENERSVRLARKLGFHEFARTAYHDIPVALHRR